MSLFISSSSHRRLIGRRLLSILAVAGESHLISIPSEIISTNCNSEAMSYPGSATPVILMPAKTLSSLTSTTRILCKRSAPSSWVPLNFVNCWARIQPSARKTQTKSSFVVTSIANSGVICVSSMLFASVSNPFSLCQTAQSCLWPKSPSLIWTPSRPMLSSSGPARLAMVSLAWIDSSVFIRCMLMYYSRVLPS
jgi:hypothetical protein